MYTCRGLYTCRGYCRAQSARAIVQQDGDSIGTLIGYRQVRFAVAVEIPHCGDDGLDKTPSLTVAGKRRRLYRAVPCRRPTPPGRAPRLRQEFSPIALLATTQDSDPELSAEFLVRFNGPLVDVTSRIKEAIKQFSPAITVEYRAFDGDIGALAELIAAVGLYGVMSYLVVRRTNEIGIRMALGANRGNIVGLALGEAATLLLVGLAAGAVLATVAGYAAQSLLFGPRPTDAAILGMAAALLAAVTIAASYGPAWRASKLEPMTALREE